MDKVVGNGAKLVLVVHDWGSALGSDWACRHPEGVRGIAYMEAIVRPLTGWEEWNPDATRIFQGFRSEKGEEMILDRNLLVERVLPGSVIRPLTETEMAEYRRPFLRPERRAPTLAWPRAFRSMGNRRVWRHGCSSTPTGWRATPSPSSSSTPSPVPS